MHLVHEIFDNIKTYEYVIVRALLHAENQHSNINSIAYDENFEHQHRYMSEDDERLGARSFGDEPKIPVGFFVALIRYCTSPKTLASSMSEILKVSRRTSEVKAGREILRQRVPETDQKYVMIRTRVRSHGGWEGYLWVRAQITSSTSSSLQVLLKPTIPQKGLTVVWPKRHP